MPAKKSVKSVARKSAKKSTKLGVKKPSAAHKAVIDHGAILSPYGKSVLRAFKEGVQVAYARMASAGISATVVEDGRIVRAVPQRRGGQFVVMEPSAKRRSLDRREP